MRRTTEPLHQDPRVITQNPAIATGSVVASSNSAMRNFEVTGGHPELDLTEARALADQIANAKAEMPILIAWYDRDRDFESPAHAGECHDGCDVPGYLAYAESRGASIRVDVDEGRFVFCYLPTGEFADTE